MCVCVYKCLYVFVDLFVCLFVFFTLDLGQLPGGGIHFPLHSDLQAWNK